MTAYPIHRTARPSTQFAPVLPMTREDERFWQLRRERAAKAKGDAK